MKFLDLLFSAVVTLFSGVMKKWLLLPKHKDRNPVMKPSYWSYRHAQGSHLVTIGTVYPRQSGRLIERVKS